MKQTKIITIQWTPDRSLSIPIYKQIVQYICSQIKNGNWEVGMQLPPQRDLAELFHVNRSTIATAMDELTSYGILEGNQKAGTRILSNSWSLFLPEHGLWNDHVGLGAFEPNQTMIQAINHLEFTPGVLRLGTGEPDPRLFPSHMWKKVLTSLENMTSFPYLEPLGLLDLRISIAKHLEQYGLSILPQQILITSGALQALQLISVCLLKPGSVMYTESPTYLRSLQVIPSANISLQGIPMDQEGILYHRIPSDASLERVLYTIPSNHNPTGITMSSKRRLDLVDHCARYHIPIIEDCAYDELFFDKEPYRPLKALDHQDEILMIGTISKTLIPGLRIGWVIGPEAVVNRMGDVKMQMDYGASSVSQWILKEFLDKGLYQEHLIQMRKVLKTRRDHAVAQLQKTFQDEIDFQIPKGGFYLWVHFHKKLHIHKLFSQAMEHGVLLNPGDIYDFAPNNCLRISFSYLEEEEFNQAIVILKELIDKE